MPEYVLGIDFGLKRIGLAIGQTLTLAASPLSVIKNTPSLINELKVIVNQWNVRQIVLGLPYDADGNEQEVSKQVRNFAKKLKHHLQLPVALHDERFTSFAAERNFQQQRAAGLKKAKDKKQIDALAAQVILQSWLDETTHAALN